MNDWSILTVGIVEDNKERITFNMLKDMFKSIGYKVHYINMKGNMLIFKKKNKEILTIDIGPDMIGNIEGLKINFDILIHNFIKLNNGDKGKLKRILKLSNSIILNCDVDNWNYLIEGNEKSIAISYGFNNKAVINLSSYNIDDFINANICFQRGLKTINGDTVEPFEIPTIIGSKEKDHIYSAMAVLASGVLIGHDNLLKNNTLRL